MSHYAVLVIGSNVEGQLAPYHEFECTEEDDEYIQEVSYLEKAKQRHRDYLNRRKQEKETGRPQTFLEFVKDEYRRPVVRSRDLCNVDPENETYKFGWIIADGKKVIDVIFRTNPNGKWDWFEIGSRWNGFFKLKPGVVSEADDENDSGIAGKESGTSSRCLKRNIDIERMHREEEEKARDLWRKCTEVINSETWQPRSVFTAREDFQIKYQEYNEFYWSQPPVARLTESNLIRDFLDIDKFLETTEEEYVEDAINDAMAPDAFIRDYKWNAPDDAGAWGKSGGKISRREWNQNFREMFDSLPDDTLLTLVDCHS